MRSNLELEIELATRAAVAAPALVARLSGVVRPTAALSLPAIEDDFDVSIVPKPFDQILVEASILARDEEQVSSHGALGQPSDVRFRAYVAH